MARRLLDPDTRGRRIVLALLGMMLLIGTGITAVWVVGYRATLDVTAHSGVPECEGTTPTTRKDAMGDGLTEVAVPIERGFSCTLSIALRNESGRTIEVHQVVVHTAGPAGRSGFEVPEIDSTPVPTGSADGDDDAVVRLGASIEPDAEYVVRLRVVFRASGCVEEGGGTKVYPTIRLTSTSAERELVVADLPWFLGTADSEGGCAG